MTSRFYFGGSDSGSDVDENDASLPFPKPIDRSAFLAPDFEATAFLSSLSDRFQTLDDLQTELRDLSHTLNKELVDLVNDNYSDFLSLGSTLSGGEEKIEDIRMSLLGFQRDIQAIRDKVDTSRNEVVELLKEKRAIKQETGVGRSLLDIAERLDQLEEKLNISTARSTQPAKDSTQANGSLHWGQDWIETATNESDDEYDSDEASELPPQLKRRIEEFLILRHLTSKHSPRHPFILEQDARIRKIQEALLSGLDVAIKQEPDIKVKQKVLQIRASVEG